MVNKPASLLVVSLGKALSQIPHLGVVDKWLATPKRARIAHRSLSRDRRINMQLNDIQDCSANHRPKSNLHYTCGIKSKRVTSDGAHLRGLAPGQH